ncbi:chromate efflux transporter [Photobacterium halotolerans]|uniref:Chromate efflux transporter n=1 Tax=Photobacterium halotolerans TaxID=265726 RepID=A0A7X4WUA0_9GAMM|nr:chromate efflux transporter [Photobacterium halotolerans]NAW66305.1 chromate efflux transporter [Photobacterium halotolerans]NAW88261.1 chromate efflux transporter [Photobacterium halotolerans]NAX46472.1 chromate efflux transporter [Photobacterium halotolerans]
MFAIFMTFFTLGWFSFGGPAAHIGYFRQTFVEKRQWLSDSEYAHIVALSQFLPGPGSSQVGFALGYRRGGLPGACMAFLGFTLPSVLIMLALAMLSSRLTELSWFESVVHGLKLLAVVVVIDATWGMFRNFCQRRLTVCLCAITAMALMIAPGIATQMTMLILAMLIGAHWLKTADVADTRPAFRPTLWPLLLFLLLFIGLPLLLSTGPDPLPAASLFSDFFQAGSLVFGGGHVVLPLLQSLIGDQLTDNTFLTGYAAAQAVPGPMFTFATYLGYALLPASPILGALLATLAVFLPGFLLLLTVLTHWQTLAAYPRVAGALQGINAAVVGLLLSALYQPVFTGAVLNGLDAALVVAGLLLLKQWKLPILWLVTGFMLAGWIQGLLS